MRGKSDDLFRDRTQEFLTIVKRLKRSAALPNDPLTNGSKSKEEASKPSEFNKKASRIRVGIHQTSQKLSKLALLAKKTGTYDDPIVEIQELTTLIKQEINSLNSGVVDLQLVCNSQNQIGSISGDSTTHSATVIDNLKTRLMSTTKEFKDVLTFRTKKLKDHENRKQIFSKKDSAANPFMHHPLANRPAPASAAPPPWANNSSTSSQLVRRRQISGDASSSTQPLMQQQQLVSVQDSSYTQNRSEALHNVESTIHELGNIFTQLATMVSQQGDIAIRIDENMDNTLENVEGAQGALARYLNGITSNRLSEEMSSIQLCQTTIQRFLKAVSLGITIPLASEQILGYNHNGGAHRACIKADLTKAFDKEDWMDGFLNA